MAGQSKLGGNLTEMFYHFCGTIWGEKSGKVLMVLWLAGLTGATSFGIYNRLNSKRTVIREKRENKSKKGSLYENLKKLLTIAFPRALCKPSFHLTFYTALLIARIVLTIKIADITGMLGKTVGSKSFDSMFKLQVVFALWCIPGAFVNSLLHFESDKFALSIREKLIRHAHNLYLNDLVYYRAGNLGSNKIEDVNQRVTQDLKKFCSQLSDLYGNLLKPILEVIFISRSLAKRMGGRQLVAFFIFFAITGQYLQFIMPPYSQFSADTQKKEGEFRSHHHRVIAHNEEIAFYGGGEREKEILNASFNSLRGLFNKIFSYQLGMGIVDQYLVKYGATMVAYSMMMPAVYLGLYGLEGKTAPEIMQYYITSSALFVALGNACKHLVLSYKHIHDLAGLTERVTELFDMLQKRSGGFDGKEDVEEMKKLARENYENITPPVTKIGEHICFENVDIFSPTGALLVKNLNFRVAKNSNVLISGPNGSGKSSLFRVLGGLWPLCSGTLTKPEKNKLFYIPQQPYLAPGTLRDQITYPVSLKDSSEDAHLNKLMELVNLSYLVAREGWNVVRDWADVLSGGEKQRVAMARLFYHKPAFGILDECTSAVSADVEGKLYETCKELGITIFTVSHRPQLRHHHDCELKFDGAGNWEWIILHPENNLNQL